MYQITKDLIIEEDGFEDVDYALIKSRNPNNCKYLIQVLNAVGLQENIFKGDEGYSFQPESIDAVKDIITNHSTYLKEMKKPPQQRSTKIINGLVLHIQMILKNEINNQSFLQSQLAKVELITLNRRQQLNKYLQSLAIPNFDDTLSAADEEIIHMYYIEEMMQLRNRIESMRKIVSEIRHKEIIVKSSKESSELKPDNVLEVYGVFTGKVKLDRLVIKDLLDPKKQKDSLIQETLGDLAKELNITEKKVIEELKNFRKGKYVSHDLFELSEERDYCGDDDFMSPYAALTQAKQEYAEQTQEEPKKMILQHELDKVAKILKERSKTNL